MRVKSLVLGTLAAVGLFALTASPASAQVIYTSPPVVTQSYFVPAPVYYPRPAYVVPSYGYGYGGYNRPAVSFGYSSGGFYRPGFGYGGGYGGGYRGGYYGGGRPGVSFGITFR